MSFEHDGRMKLVQLPRDLVGKAARHLVERPQQGRVQLVLVGALARLA